MQTTYSSEPAIARAGMLADSRLMKHTASRIAAGSIKAGLGVFRVPSYGQPGTRTADPGQVYQNPSPAAAVDVDALLTLNAGAAAGVTIDAEDLNGVHGNAEMIPARNITVTTTAHADHDADADGLTVTYYNQEGVLVEEVFATADGGGETHTTAQKASRFVSAVFAADSMTSANATFSIGVTVLDSGVTLADFEGVALYDSAKEPGVGAFARTGALSVQGISTFTATAEYADQESVPVLVRGAVWVETEDACSAGGSVFVRIGAGAGGTQLGAFRSDADTATAVTVTGARYARDSQAGELNQVEFY
jgi:hypothetical protein